MNGRVIFSQGHVSFIWEGPSEQITTVQNATIQIVLPLFQTLVKIFMTVRKQFLKYKISGFWKKNPSI
jgi:hypothetical protein